MKQNKKGFTLIELLAVIVILAIIALIAVPVIMNIITKARQSAAADTAYSILNAAELHYAEHLLENPTEAYTVTGFTFPSDTQLKIKGTRPTAGAVKINANGTASIDGSLTINNFSCIQDANGTITCGNN